MFSPVLVELDSHLVHEAAGIAGLRHVVLEDALFGFGHGGIRDALRGIGGQVVLVGRIRQRANQAIILPMVFRLRPAVVWWLADGAGFVRVELHGTKVVAVEGPVSVFEALARSRMAA